MSLSILADENIPAVDHYLAALGSVRTASGRNLQPSQLKGVDVLLVRSVTRVNEALLHGSAVKFVGTATSGVDHIDLDYLSAQGIGFAHAPGSNANSVVEYVLTAISAIDHKLEQLLAGGTVGIVGYGVIGKILAARLRTLGINHLVYDPWLDEEQITHPGTLQQILACDVVTLHPELTREQPWPSFHLLGETELATLRPGCLLVNASRGPVVDNAALSQRLLQGNGPVVVLDVWESEPAINHTLLQQVELGTSHIAGYSLDGKLLATRMLGDAVTAQFGLPASPQCSPAGEPTAVGLPSRPRGAELMRLLLQARYDIFADDARLRGATLGSDTTSAAQGFDALRKNYADRRELCGSQVLGPFYSQTEWELVRALGCLPVPEGSPP